MSNTVTKIGKTNFLGAQIDEKVTKEKINEIIDEVNSIKPYKVYVAKLAQSGTDAPTAIVLENTLGGEVVWSYSSEGVYVGTLVGAFPNTEDKFYTTYITALSATTEMQVAYLDTDSFEVDTVTYGGFGGPATVTDGLLYNTPIEIRVYN